MTQETFEERLETMLEHLVEMMEKFCYNVLSHNFMFLVELDGTVDGNDHVQALHGLKGKELFFNEVVDLLCHEGKTPQWIDCSVYYAESRRTVVHLLLSTTFTDESEIYYKETGIGPFKPVVMLPPDHLRVEIDGRFDVNWKNEADYDQHATGLWWAISKLLRKLFKV